MSSPDVQQRKEEEPSPEDRRVLEDYIAELRKFREKLRRKLN